MRATEVFLLPEVLVIAIWWMDKKSRTDIGLQVGQFNGTGLLSLVGVLSTSVHVQVAVLGSTQAVVLQHAFHSVLDYAARVAVHLLAHRATLLATGVARVGDVDLLGHFLARHAQLVGVDNNYIVTAVGVGREGRLVLAAQNVGNLRANAAQRGYAGVDDNPAFLGVGLVNVGCLEAQVVHESKKSSC